MAITRINGLTDFDLAAGDLVLALSGAGYAADDFAIIVSKQACNGVNPTHTLSGTSGWTLVRSDLEVGGLDKKCFVWTKKLTGSETDVTVETDLGNEFTALMEIYRGVDTSTPFDVSEVQGDSANVALPTNSPITTITANAAVVLYLGQVQAGSTTVAVAPSGYTLGSHIDSNDDSDNELPTYFAYLLDAGAIGTKTPGAWQNTGSASSADNLWYTFALRPAAGGGDVTAPLLSSPLATDVTATTLIPKCTTDEGNGTMYMVVVPNNDVPSVAQVKAGQQSSGAAAIASANISVSTTGQQTFAKVTGLTIKTDYELYFVHTDVALNNSLRATVGFTTVSVVRIVNSDIDADPTLVAVPGAGNKRAAYYAVGVGNLPNPNGQFSATALSIGGQTGTLVSTVKAPGGTYREGIGLSIFEFLEAKIALFSNGIITPTWGDVDGEPLTKKYAQITFSDVDQTNPRGALTTYNNDLTVATWAPGNVFSIDKGMVFSASQLGGGPLYTYDSLNETLNLIAGSCELLVGTLETTDASNKSLNLTAAAAHRPNTVIGFKINPIDIVNPTLSVPLANDIGTSTVTPSVVTTDEYGSLYYVVVPDGDFPNAAQIIAGNNSSNNPAISDGSITPPVIGTNTFTEVIGLSNGVSYELAFAHQDGAGNISNVSTVGFTTGSAATPDVTTAPTVVSQTTTAYTVNLGEVTENGTAYLGAYIPGSTPTAAQIEAGTNAHGTANKAHIANTPIGTVVLTPTDAPVYPYYDIKIVYKSAAGYSFITTLSEFLDAPTGKQYTLMTTGPYASWLDNASPAPVVGNVLIWDLVSTPGPVTGDYEFTISGDGHYILDVDDDLSRQSAEREMWRLATQAWSGEQLFYINNQPPISSVSELADIELLDNVAFASIDFEQFGEDAEGDILTVAQSPDDPEAMPAGITFVSNDFVVTHGSLVPGVYVILVRWTDIAGDYFEEQQNVLVLATAQMPDVRNSPTFNVTQAAAVAAITGAGLASPVIGYASSLTVTAGNVIQQSPASGEYFPIAGTGYVPSITVSADIGFLTKGAIGVGMGKIGLR